MPAKVNIGALLRKHLGKEVADAMAVKIDQMISQKKSAAEIERAFQADLSAYMVSVSAEVKPLIEIKVEDLSSVGVLDRGSHLLQTHDKRVGVMGVPSRPPLKRPK